MANTYPVRIVTPDRVVFEGRARSLIAPGREGSFGVLFEHAPMVAELKIGEMTLTEESGGTKFFALSGGFLEVSNLGEVTVLADSAEAADDIDLARAQAAQQRASERLARMDSDLDNARAQAALRRALNRVRVAGKGN